MDRHSVPHSLRGVDDCRRSGRRLLRSAARAGGRHRRVHSRLCHQRGSARWADPDRRNHDRRSRCGSNDSVVDVGDHRRLPRLSSSLGYRPLGRSNRIRLRRGHSHGWRADERLRLAVHLRRMCRNCRWNNVFRSHRDSRVERSWRTEPHRLPGRRSVGVLSGGPQSGPDPGTELGLHRSVDPHALRALGGVGRGVRRRRVAGRLPDRRIRPTPSSQLRRLDGRHLRARFLVGRVAVLPSPLLSRGRELLVDQDRPRTAAPDRIES